MRLARLALALAASAALVEPSHATSGAAAKRSEPRVASRIYSVGQTTWVWAEPKKTPKSELGYVRVGESAALRSLGPKAGAGCARGFYAVEPYGWVCLDASSSLDPDARYLRAMQHARPSTAKLPFGYALSNGAPMYRRLPKPAEWQKVERPLGPAGQSKPLSWGNRGHEQLAERRLVGAAGKIPDFLLNGGSAASAEPLGLVRRHIPLGSMLAYSSAFAHAGRTWLLSSDLTVVPADRVRPYRESSFRGVELGSGTALPIAWIRGKPRPKYARGEGGAFTMTGAEWGLRSAVALDDALAIVEDGKLRLLQTDERDGSGRPLFIAERDATVVRAREELPFSVGERDKWLIVSITAGTLVAYEGKRPVFATLVSSGAGGVPIPGKDPVKMSTTPMGIYRVTFKHRAATMSPEKGEDRSFWIADVPHTQYFNAPFALHTAYWHENFGEPMSAGCINLSPSDGERLFTWTEPRVPEGWNGSAAGGPNGKGTFVIVVR